MEKHLDVFYWLGKERVKAYLILILITTVYFGFLLRDGKWWFYDDFLDMRTIDTNSYLDLARSSVDGINPSNHKFLGYFLLKGMYQVFGAKFFPYLALNFVIHTINTLLMFEILARVVRRKWISLGLAGVFGIRLWLAWISNMHDLLAGMIYFGVLLIWLSKRGKLGWLGRLGILGLYGLGLAAKATTLSLPVTLVLLAGSGILGRVRWQDMAKSVVPLLVMTGAYLARFGEYIANKNIQWSGYEPVFTVSKFVQSQAIYLGSLSEFFPKLEGVALGVLGLSGVLGWKKERRWLWWLTGAYLVAIAPMSFFAAHASMYYIYIPVVFLLMLVGKLAGELGGTLRQGSGRAGGLGVIRGLVWVGLVVLLFNPLAEVRKMVTKYRHPELRGFDERNMEKLVGLAKQAIGEGRSEFYFSSWEMSPNLYSAVYHDAVGLFVGNKEWDKKYKYGYDREKELVLIWPRDRDWGQN